jgi:hypothetical protein
LAGWQKSKWQPRSNGSEEATSNILFPHVSFDDATKDRFVGRLKQDISINRDSDHRDSFEFTEQKHFRA